MALAIVVVWGANFSVQKFLLPVLSPSGLLFARYLAMPVCALLLLVWHFGWRMPRIAREDLWALARLAFFGHFVHVGMVTYGIHWSTAFSSSLILACAPIFTLLILRWMGIERLRPMQIVGVAIAFAGVLVFLSDKLLAADWRATGGDLFLLVASSFFSYYTVAAKPLIQKYGGVSVMAYGTLLGAVPILAISALPGSRIDWGGFGLSVWLAMFWAIVISSFIGWLLWGWVNTVRGVARTAPLMYLMPPVAAAVAWIVTGERYTAAKVLGAAITLSGVALAQFSGSGGARDAPAPVD